MGNVPFGEDDSGNIYDMAGACILLICAAFGFFCWLNWRLTLWSFGFLFSFVLLSHLIGWLLRKIIGLVA